MDIFPLKIKERIQKVSPNLLEYLEKTGERHLFLVARQLMMAGASKEMAIKLGDDALFVNLWEKSGMVQYVIDSTLTETLIEQCEGMDTVENLPTALLSNLPHECFAVRFAPFGLVQGEVECRFTGECMVRYLSESESLMGSPLLYCLWEMDYPYHRNMAYGFPLDAKTIKEAFRKLKGESCQDFGVQREDDSVSLELAASALAVQFVLYLQADNADVKSVVQQKTKKGKKGKNNPKPKTAIKKVEVGYNVGRLIRKAKKDYDEQIERAEAEPREKKKGAKKRPHARRGHWHHYWVGPRNDPTKRKLVLHWIPPSFINTRTTDITKPTVVKVMK